MGRMIYERHCFTRGAESAGGLSGFPEQLYNLHYCFLFLARRDLFTWVDFGYEGIAGILQ